MNKDSFDMAVNRVIDLNMKAIDQYEKLVILPMIDDLKHPERIINKPYEQWMPQDFQLLQQVYQATPDILNKFIANKEYEILVNLHKEV
jgi:hypothetical protein